MGTQPNRRLSKAGGGIRSRKLIKSVKDATKDKDYDKAVSHITNAALKSGGADFLTSALIAGAIAYSTKKSETRKSIKSISGDAITELPKEVKKNLTKDGKDAIRSALYYALSSRNK